MNGKISEQNFKEKQDICITSKYLYQYLLFVVVLTYVHKFSPVGGAHMWPNEERNVGKKTGTGDAAGQHHLDQVTGADISSSHWGPDS